MFRTLWKLCRSAAACQSMPLLTPAQADRTMSTRPRRGADMAFRQPRKDEMPRSVKHERRMKRTPFSSAYEVFPLLCCASVLGPKPGSRKRLTCRTPMNTSRSAYAGQRRLMSRHNLVTLQRSVLVLVLTIELAQGVGTLRRRVAHVPLMYLKSRPCPDSNSLGRARRGREG
ncbi:hypothetical protein CC85DRAFT_78209 [Cutaneotrichosporon oleaginosum]|uniref:Uncharacterized protein n=1 Tax=Cutaneotrichosporon oleaginosum TaxID=879819 RepID=A0A0J0XNN4_9TREE|nr:uncharacterized protein CC85DRAFT_78209 [Cutaneotrichosporon oleaginosum]KLT42736.1 hypothetical protein CC85DRAFT_78209 [Cutaneotrichosporon oleaginosum]TXT09545.1 hypothetical protein COLE_03479 [Cutaneotrichosporon oleaginosum]